MGRGAFPVSFLKDILAGKNSGFLGQFPTLLMFFSLILSQKEFQKFKSLLLILFVEANNNQVPSGMGHINSKCSLSLSQTLPIYYEK